MGALYSSFHRVRRVIAQLRRTPLRAVSLWHAMLFVHLLVCCTTPAQADASQYTVQITAPHGLDKLLESNLDIVRWSKRTDVTPGQMEQLYKTAPEQITELLATEGYFSSHVEASIDREKKPEVIHFAVDPGEAVHVSSIDLRVVGDVKNDPEADARIAQVGQAFAIKVGDVFRQTQWNAAKDSAVHSLARKVYAAARITSSRVQVNPEAHTAEIQLELDSGPPMAFGELVVTGLKRYSKRIVVNLNPIRPGDAYNEDELIKFQRRLLTAGYFATAVVTARADRSSTQRVPVTVTLVEAPAKRVEVGVGLSTDRGPRGQIDYSDSNAFDRAWRFSSNLYVDRLSQSVTGGLQFPRLESGWRYSTEGKFRNEDIQGQHTTDWSVVGAHTYTVETYESQQALQFLTERSALVGGTVDNRQALFLSQRWTFNNLDDLINPHRGYFATLQVGGASAEVLSTRTFGRVDLKGAYLQPFGPKWTLGLRAEVGVVLAGSREGIPSAYVFRTGGDNTIRGYAFESLGVAENGAIVGGRYLVIGSAELTRWLTPQWGAAVFYDTGNAFDDRHDFNPVNGYGAGVRWRSPVGSLSLDLAYGEEVKSFRVHFSAGYAFR